MRIQRLPTGIGPPPDATAFTDALRRRPGRPVVLDVGFGDGRLLPAIQRADGDWLGVDVSPERVATARNRGWPARCADLTDRLPVADASIDAVVLTFVLNQIPERARRRAAVAEIRRVLRPGGLLWIVDFERLPFRTDPRIGRDVPAPHWQAMRRRYRLGPELASWVLGVAPDALARGSFPAFDVLVDRAGTFTDHRYTAIGFRRAVQRRDITVPFVACHPTLAEWRTEWRCFGPPRSVHRTVRNARGGAKLPVVDVLLTRP